MFYVFCAALPSLKEAPSASSCKEDCAKSVFTVNCVPDPSIVKDWKTELKILPLQDWIIGRTWTSESIMADPELSRYFHYNSSDPVSIALIF